ncbi:MAG: 7TM domain-containing protein [Lacipirellulaceae bacterium]
MSARFLSQLAIAGLVLLGTLGIYLRHGTRSAAREAQQDSNWLLTYVIGFTAEGNDSEVRIAFPTEGRNIRVLKEELSAPNLRPDVVKLGPSGTREMVVFTTQQGVYSVTAEFELRLQPARAQAAEEYVNLGPETRARYTRAEPELPTGLVKVQQALQRAEWTREEELVQWIFDYCSDLKREEAAGASHSVLGALENQAATPLSRARTMVTLCRASDVPARMVTGFEIRQGSGVKPHVWLEVFRGNRWVPFDPEYGYARDMPSNFLVARRDGENIVRTRVAAPAATESYTISRMGPPPEVLMSETRRPSQVFDLTRLPVKMHEVLSLLLLLPFGALIASLFRNVVGIRTFGTFAPALFAVSFIYADWGSGLIVLFVVLFAGMFGRVLVERLRLLMVPRLSILLTTIILCVVFGVSALDYLGITPSAKAVLLPLVILTILIERFYVTIEEDGFTFAIQLTLGTLLVATCCYLLLSWKAVGDFILVYPEAHLLTLAAFVAIGRYTGYRLTELYRFRDLVKAEQAARGV